MSPCGKQQAYRRSSCSGDPTSSYTAQALWSALLCRQNNQSVDKIRVGSIAYRGHWEGLRRVHWSELPEKRLLETLRPRWKVLLKITREKNRARIFRRDWSGSTQDLLANFL